MKTESIKVSYRDKSTNPPTRVPLGTIDSPRFDNVQEALDYFEAEEVGKGEETCLEYIHTALDIELQGQYRDANRPDRPKVQSAVSKFKQLSAEKQEELLRKEGLL